MTTAARPTFDTARGGSGTRERDLSAISKQYSARDLPGHTRLKNRDVQVESQSREELKRELELREREAKGEKSNDSGSKRPRLSEEGVSSLTHSAHLDADDPALASDESDDSDNSDSDDDTELLMAELQKIKHEKAAEEQEREALEKAEAEQIRMENILSGNPLLKDRYAASTASTKSDLRVKRRWDDDVVFKNCSKAAPEKKEASFINDSLRSEFHRKFMNKYIK